MPVSMKTSFKGLFLLLAVLVSTYSLGHYWIYAQVTSGDLLAVKFRSLNTLLVYSHLVGGAIALLLGAIQLFSRKGSPWHRRLGIGYCIAVVIGGIGGGYLSFFSDAGRVTGIGFFLLDGLWFYTTYMAVSYARAHQVELHRRWIIRSLALVAAAISLRIQLPIYMQFWSFETSYLIVAWSCWMGNLLLAEIYLYLTSPTLVTSKGNLSS